MKKYISLLLAALVLCGSLSLAFASPASAAEVESPPSPLAIPEGDLPEYRSFLEDTYSGWYCILTDAHAPELLDYCIIPLDPSSLLYVLTNGEFPGPGPWGRPFRTVTDSTCYVAGYWEAHSDFFFWSPVATVYPFAADFLESWSSLSMPDQSFEFYVYFPEGTHFDPGNTDWQIREVADFEFADYEPLPEGFFGEIYTMIKDAFYGSSQITGYQDLIVTTLATSIIVFLFCIPFILVAVVVFCLFKGWH